MARSGPGTTSRRDEAPQCTDELQGHMAVTRIASVLIVVFIGAAAAVVIIWRPGAGAPYPASAKIATIHWEPESKVIRLAPGSDNWPLTWADDDKLYTAYGDGTGFAGYGNGRNDVDGPGKRLSLGIAVVDGGPEAPSGRNIAAPTAEQTGSGSKGRKASGMLFVDGTLYMWARNANDRGEGCQLASSGDYGVSWEWAAWRFDQLGYCAFANFGKANAWSRDDFAYVYSPDGPSAYKDADGLVLARVPTASIADRNAYRFFAGVDADGRAQWSAEFRDRKNVFEYPDGVNRVDVTYDGPLDRFLMTMRDKAREGGHDHFSIYDAPDPWGPWTTVYFVQAVKPWARLLGNSARRWGESAHIPAKWISDDGRTVNVVFSQDDSFSVRRAELTLR